MRVMIVGSGGREHALAWKLAQSPQVEGLFVAPGNGGTAAIAENVAISATDVPALVDFARGNQIDLTVVGPEAPLAAGLVDALGEANLRAFGPTAAAAQLEGSKVFAKRFMFEEGIPTGMGAIFGDYDAALAYLRNQPAPIVVKASGLAAGKGVAVCATLEDAEEALHRTMVDRAFGEAGDQVLVEVCLEGEEASLLAFSDGKTVVPMLPARDYKRVGDGDAGPNTGGMGGYAPSPYLPPDLIEEVQLRILQPTVDGMRQRGMPYVGVLYAGLMLTDQGPRVLEFNCRFGDPETQVLLPLLESDLVDIFLACLEGRLDEVDICWEPRYTTCVVLASAGYPGAYEKGKEITGVEEVDRLSDVVVFQAGTRQERDRLVTAGGRVLAVTATGTSLSEAQERAYVSVERVDFEGAHYRRDIGAGAEEVAARVFEAVQSSACEEAPPQSAYAAAGVDIDAKMGAFRRMRASVEGTYTPAVIAGMGPFGGLYALDDLLKADDPILVSSTDGVGTKTMVAAAMGYYEGIGHDIVNHCINDILVQGARPLFFLDYMAAGKLDPDTVVAIVTSCSGACRAAGCALIGGETAEMPGVYQPGTFDLVGTIVGWVERGAIIDGRDVQPGDVCLGVPSSGLHTNGYSLARRVFADVGWETVLPELGRPLGKVLLEPHRAYLHEFQTLVDAGLEIKAMSHITGGGFPDNLPRVLPPRVGVRLDRSAWEVPAIFRLIQELGNVDELEMYHVFNMGIGMIVIVSPQDVDGALETLPEAVVVGEAIAWEDEGDLRVRL